MNTEFRTAQVEQLAEGILSGSVSPSMLDENNQVIRETLEHLVATDPAKVAWSMVTSTLIARGLTGIFAYTCTTDEVECRVDQVTYYAKNCTGGCYSIEYMLSNRETLVALAQRMLRHEEFSARMLREMVDRSLIIDFSLNLIPA
jgi:hypothetical protein